MKDETNPEVPVPEGMIRKDELDPARVELWRVGCGKDNEGPFVILQIGLREMAPDAELLTYSFSPVGARVLAARLIEQATLIDKIVRQ